MVIAAVLGGGSGLRFGSAVPKQYLDLRGVPVIVRSIKAFDNSGMVDKIICAVPSNDIDLMRLFLEKNAPFSVPVEVIAGGTDRGSSLLNVLNFIKAASGLEDTVILTHDAVRPFITDRIIAENIEAAEKYGACCTCIPATDTVFISGDGTFENSIPSRSTVYNAQTPQSFNAHRLYELITALSAEKYSGMTDTCSVFVDAGEKVALVRGETFNIKLTYAEDLNRAELIFDTYFAKEANHVRFNRNSNHLRKRRKHEIHP